MKRLSILLLLVGVGLLPACGDDSGGGDAGVDSGPGWDGDVEGYQCTKDPQLIVTRTQCREDVQCPCGSYCERGLCRHDCIEDDDCNGWCDFFGHCRDASDRRSIPEVTRPDPSQLLVSPSFLPVYDWNLETDKKITLQAPQRELFNVRLVASTGLLVRCQTEFVSDCVVPTVPTTGQVSVALRVQRLGGTPRQAWTLTAHFQNQIEVVGLKMTEPPREIAVEPGVYEGRIWMQNANTTLQTDQPLVAANLVTRFNMLGLPASLKVYPDGTLVLSDLAGIVPTDWVFLLRSDYTFDALEGQTDRSRRIYLGGAQVVAPTTTEVTISADGTLKSFQGGVNGTLTMRVGGMGLTYAPALGVDERPHLGWGFAMTRTGDIPAGDTPPPLGAPVEPGFSPVADRYTDPLPWQAETAACFVSDSDFQNVGPTLTSSIQSALCFDHGATLSSVEFMAADPANLNTSGDLLCEGGNPNTHPTVMPFFTYGDRANTAPTTPQQLLQYCLSDLAYAQAGPSGTTLTDAACLNQLAGCGNDGVCQTSDNPDCLAAPLTIRAIAQGMSAITRQGMPDQIHWTVTDVDGAKMSLRVLQQWIQVHTFVAREATQEADQYLGTVDLTGLGTALARSIAGWDLLLHPRVAARLMHLPPALLGAPDYRGSSFAPGTMSQDITQAVGMPVVILEALRAQIEAAAQIVYLTRFRGGALPDSLADTMRYAAVMVPLAQMLHQRATVAGTVSWESLWVAAVDQIALALKRYVTQWRALEAGKNPLGVEDNDLPLYRGLTNPDAAGMRFEAISTYLMDNFAQDAVTVATAAKADADAAWDLLLQRQLQADQQAQVPSRVEEIKRLYGEKILSLCGNPYGLLSHEVFDEGAWPGLSPDTCFMNPVNSACQFNEQALLDKLTTDDVAYQLCVQSKLHNQLGDRARLDSEDVNDWVDAINAGTEAQAELSLIDYMPQDATEWWDTAKVVDPGIVEMIVDYTICTKDAQCPVNDLFVLDHYEDPGTEDELAYLNATRVCQSIFPGRKPIGQMAMEDPALDLPECYQGSLGELVLASRSAAKDVQAAGSALEDYTSKYRSAVWQCTIDDSALEMSQSVTDDLEEIEEKLESYGATTHFLVDAIRTTVSAIPTIMGVLTGDSDSRKEVLNSTFDLVTGGIFQAQDEITGLNNVRTLHEDFLTDWEDQIQDAKCFHDAEMHLIGGDTQARRMEKAKLDLSVGILKTRNAKAEVARYLKEGAHRINAVSTQSRMSLFHDVWRDLWTGTESSYKGKIETYRRKMRLAQRMLYLTVRAVEYELQVTQSSLRVGVLAAQSPAELDQIVTQLNAIIGAGNIGGQTPGNRHVELSLKENLLQLADRSDLPVGLNTMTDTQRFQAMLVAKRYAHFDANGEYDGQLIPFSVAPMGAIGLGDPGTIHLLTGVECAERLWSVTASLQGTNLTDDNATYLQMGVLHKNDFYSQWCLTPEAGQGEMQLGSVRPARNLFQDPVWGGDYGASNPTDSEYVVSLVNAYFNVSWDEFTQQDYSEGSDTALSCRGLYGQYAVFFPAQILSMEGSSGLSLRNIDDIWLRFDYVSAAKQWQ